jgi:hypothetical protein
MHFCYKIRLMIAGFAVAPMSASGATAGCAKFSCIQTPTGFCYFVVFRQTDGDARFDLVREARRWISGVSPGDTYCATLHNQPGEACPIRPVRDIKQECPSQLLSHLERTTSEPKE